jgi:hypothetical protein
VNKVGVIADDVARDLGILEVRNAPLICRAKVFQPFDKV